MKKIKSCFVLQQDESDCGVACLLTIIRFYGGNDTFENLRRLSGTTPIGTSLLGLQQAASNVGFISEGCEANLESLLNHKAPCILHVTTENNLHHYIVYFGTVSKATKEKETIFLVGDPAKGIIELKFDELLRIWKSKACLILEPSNTFKEKQFIETEKMNWFRELLQEDYPFLIIAALLGIIIAALGLTMSLYSQHLIDNILPHKSYKKLFTGIALVFILLIIKEGMNMLRTFLLLQQSKEFNVRIINNFFSKLLKLPKSFFDSRKIGDLTARLNDTARIQKVITQITGNILLDSLIVIVTILFIFYYERNAGIFVIFALPFFFFLVYRNSKVISFRQREIMSTYAMAESNYISTLQGIEPIHNYNKQDLFTTLNNIVYKNYQQKVFILGKMQLSISFLINALATLLICGLLTYLSTQVLKGYLKIGELMAITGMFASLLPSVANLALLVIPLSEARIAFDRMYEFAFTPAEKDSLTSELNINFEKLEVDHISFRFPGQPQLLKDISFQISLGEVIAIMGENGSGKSTLSLILQRHYYQERGSVIVNDSIEMGAIQLRKWRTIHAVVPQSIHIFSGTILYNIAFEDETNNPGNVLQFLKDFDFIRFFKGLPQSVFTKVGDDGINLSGGQKQIIAFARALYHKPQLLILDEATSAMDRESEQFVLHVIEKLRKNISVIFITHRLHILKTLCDRIYIIHNGKIQVAGKHSELLKTNNLYSQYWSDLNNHNR